MKITKIDTFLVNMGHRNIPYVKVHTDEGIHGVGEAYSCGPDKATVEVIQDFEEWLIGRDPRDIEGLWHLMYAGSRFPGGMVVNAAISGIEHALWDICGQGRWAARLPAGRRQVPRQGPRLSGAARATRRRSWPRSAVALIEKYGYTAIKMGPLPAGLAGDALEPGAARDGARVAAVREAVGQDIDIGLDPHARIFEVIRRHGALRRGGAVSPLLRRGAAAPGELRRAGTSSASR